MSEDIVAELIKDLAGSIKALTELVQKLEHWIDVLIPTRGKHVEEMIPGLSGIPGGLNDVEPAEFPTKHRLDIRKMAAKYSGETAEPLVDDGQMFTVPETLGQAGTAGAEYSVCDHHWAGDGVPYGGCKCIKCGAEEP